MKDVDNEHVLRCLDSALRVFRGSHGRPSVAEIKIQSLLEVIRKTVAHQAAGQGGGSESNPAANTLRSPSSGRGSAAPF